MSVTPLRPAGFAAAGAGGASDTCGGAGGVITYGAMGTVGVTAVMVGAWICGATVTSGGGTYGCWIGGGAFGGGSTFFGGGGGGGGGGFLSSSTIVAVTGFFTTSIALRARPVIRP